MIGPVDYHAHKIFSNRIWRAAGLALALFATPASAEKKRAEKREFAAAAVSVFPPPDVAPPFERSAKPGDGKWAALGNAATADRAADSPQLLFQTTLHPHPVSRFISVSIVAIDLTRAELHLVAGSEDPVAAHAPKSARTGLVPKQHQDSLLAVFNGGYQTPHGHWGVMIDALSFVPPRDSGCTLALYRDGSVRLRTWTVLAATQARMTAFRQTPPCLLEEGQLHPDLEAKREAAWGGRVPNIKTRNRSAVGVDRSGRVLFYGFGNEANPALLAEAMRAAGSFAAAQLDINYYWTRFLLFGSAQGKALAVTSALATQMQRSSREYVSIPSRRDFFYVRRR